MRDYIGPRNPKQASRSINEKQGQIGRSKAACRHGEHSDGSDDIGSGLSHQEHDGRHAARPCDGGYAERKDGDVPGLLGFLPLAGCNRGQA